MIALKLFLKRVEYISEESRDADRDNYIRVDLSGTEGTAIVSIYTEGSKTENHVGAGMVAVKNSHEIHTETQRLNSTCTVFQAEFCGIIMAVDWLKRQQRKPPPMQSMLTPKQHYLTSQINTRNMF